MQSLQPDVPPASAPRSREAVEGRIRLAQRLGAVFHSTAFLGAALTIGLLAGIFVVLLHGAWPSIGNYGLGFFLSTSQSINGALPPVVGTLITSALALLLAVPIALAVALFISESAPHWLRGALVYVVDLSAAIPSVVYGLWALIVLVPVMRGSVEPALSSLTGGAFPFPDHHLGEDLLTASVVLAAMVIPTIAAVSREALQAVPRAHRESALSLGATRWEATRMSVLGPARNGIVGGVMLGFGRAIGEAIAVSMVIGNIFALPTSIFSQSTTLASWIANDFTAAGPSELSELIELGLILLLISVAVNILARLLLHGADRAEGKLLQGVRSLKNRMLHSRSPKGAVRGSLTRSPPAKSLTDTLSRKSGNQGWFESALYHAPARRKRRLLTHKIMIGLTLLGVVIAILPLVSVLLTAFSLGGADVIRPAFYISTPPGPCPPSQVQACPLGGIGPELQGTLILLLIASSIAIPVGLLAGIYVSEYGKGRFGKLVSFSAEVMTGVPTILLGLFAFALFFALDADYAVGAIVGGFALSVMMIPIVTRATEAALLAVPTGVREAGLALGFARHRLTLRVILGCARNGLITGVLLSMSRAAGDTAALLLTAGYSIYWIQGGNTPVAALSTFIFANYASSQSNLQEAAWGAALVLLLVMLVISLITRLVMARQAHPVPAD